ncbi:hypothetical protein B0I35DRAFT_444924 [Stachybotrys elegans]|uniref:HAM1-like N-terminal domain-containing protein n=1 Tax=Stachybotrys elegans TaxID=80388 RepID=A0A8K0SDW9_9HYPO|nr:hypothetical protein B0I35DRAFT_444924 [Stachybotrys elegans]
MSCFGRRRSTVDDPERQPLLPQYDEDTALQARLHEKLHTYQMVRALGKGFMPSNEQAIAILRATLSSDALNPYMSELSGPGRALVSDCRLWIEQLIKILHQKNSKDQIQDFIWYLAKSRVDVETTALQAKASASKASADAAATAKSLQTVASLLLTNSDFRLFLSDLSTVGREILRDTAFTLSEVSKETGKRLEPEHEVGESSKGQNGGSEAGPSKDDLKDEAKDVASALAQGGAEVVHEAEQSVVEHFTGDEKDVLLDRLKQTVMKLRQKRDYSDSVSTLSMLVRQYLKVYARGVLDTARELEDNVNENEETDRALKNFWLFIVSFGDRKAWENVEKSFNKLVEDGRASPDFNNIAEKLAALLQESLTDLDFYENFDDRTQEVREKFNQVTAESHLRENFDKLFNDIRVALHSVTEDADMQKFKRTSSRIINILSPSGQYVNHQLMTDSVNVFLPRLIQAIQYIPIPRLEVSTPSIDLLLENLILEPGRTVNNSSFLPYRLRVMTQNDIDVRKGLSRTTSSMTSLLVFKMAGLSIAADDVGFWTRLHPGIGSFVDQGIAGFHLDERGIDITMTLEVGLGRLEELLTLKRVDVKIHHLNYKLSKSRFACLAWFFKPFIRPLVRKAMEVKISNLIAQAVHTLNRELVFARERLRAARIANPGDLGRFLKAVAARLVPEPDPDVETRAGVYPSKGVFRGKYAPGSLVRVWEEEGRQAAQRVYQYEVGGWRNEIFSFRSTLDDRNGLNGHG